MLYHVTLRDMTRSKPSDPLKQLRLLRDLDRGKLLCDARAKGFDWETIAEASGMSRTSAMRAAKQANGGVLPVGPSRWSKWST